MASSFATALQPAGGATGTVTNLHPSVLLSICDCYIRRNEGQERVIGTLLGNVNTDGSIEIRNSYAVPHNESNEQVAVDIEYHRTMFDLHQRVNSKEIIVGWYSTGSGIHPSDCLIQDFYGHEFANPVHVSVDTSFSEGKSSVCAYVSSSLSLEDKTMALQFYPITLVLKMEDAERIGFENLKKTNVEKLPTDLEGIENSIFKILTMIDDIYAYVDDVVEGKALADNDVGRMLDDILSSLPNISNNSFEKLFNSSIQDMLLVLYLANLTRTQLSLAQKLNTVAQPV